MFHFGQRKLCVTRTMTQKNEICDLLQRHHIACKVSMMDETNHPDEIKTRLVYADPVILHSIYVKKKDYEFAVHLLKDII